MSNGNKRKQAGAKFTLTLQFSKMETALAFLEEAKIQYKGFHYKIEGHKLVLTGPRNIAKDLMTLSSKAEYERRSASLY